MTTEITGLEGTLPAGKIPVVASRYNAAICDSMVAASLSRLHEVGYGPDDTPVIRVPGAWELPAVVNRVVNQPGVIAVIALGCVIKGETTHDQHINRAVSGELMRIGIRQNVPIGFGLLTCNTLEQAINRSGGTVGNKGQETTDAVLELLRLDAKLSL